MTVRRRNRVVVGSNNKGRIHHSASNGNGATQQLVAVPVAVAVIVPVTWPLDPQEAARIVRATPVDPSTQIVRHLAIFRFILFLILVYTYVRYFPHAEIGRHLVDSWFTYDQFGFFFHWAPKHGDDTSSLFALGILTFAVFFGMLTAMGGINGIQYSFSVSGFIFLSLYAFRFFLWATTYHDCHYLLWLLGVITVVTGGGSFFLIFTQVEEQMTPEQQQCQRHKRQVLIQQSEWGAITLRLQFAVVFLYSSVWKLHTDYLQGFCLKELLMIGSKPEAPPYSLQPFQRGGIWENLEQQLGSQIFPIVAMTIYLGELAMFLAFAFRRPTVETSRQFFGWSLLFHAFVALTTGHRLGYSFSFISLTATLIFYPIGGGSKVANAIDSATSSQSTIKKRILRRQHNEETNLVGWIQRYVADSPEARANRQQQLFTIAWILVQILIPLRMAFVPNYPFTARRTRFSWINFHKRQTIILHMAKDTSAVVHTQMVPLHLFYLVPECSANPLLRKDYMPERAVSNEDPRSLPFNSILSTDQNSLLRTYPRYAGRFAGGMSLVLHQIGPEVCAGQKHVSVYAVYFTKINGRGAFCRIFDPTINLSLSEIMRYRRSFWDSLWGVILDEAPKGYEFILSQGIGTMNSKIESHRSFVERSVSGAERIEFIADRAACLASRPLALWPNGLSLAVMVLEAPSDVAFFITNRVKNDPDSTNVTAWNQWDSLLEPQTTVLQLRKLHSVAAVSIEIGAVYDKNSSNRKKESCLDTTMEDILLALIFLP